MIKDDQATQQHTPEQIRAMAKQWYEERLASELKTLALVHGARWPAHREWLEAYVAADLKIRLRNRLIALGWGPKHG